MSKYDVQNYDDKRVRYLDLARLHDPENIFTRSFRRTVDGLQTEERGIVQKQGFMMPEGGFLPCGHKNWTKTQLITIFNDLKKCFVQCRSKPTKGKKTELWYHKLLMGTYLVFVEFLGTNWGTICR